MDAPLDQSHDKNIFILCGFLFICVIALFVVNLIINSVGQKTPTPPTQKTLKNSDVNPTSSVRRVALPTPVPPPKVQFDNYNLKTSLPVLPSTVQAFTFKTKWTETDITTFATRFGLSNVTQSTEDPRFYTAANIETGEKKGYMIIDAETGNFQFNSYGIHKPSIALPNQSAVLTAQLYLKEIGLDDGKTTCTNTYERTNYNDAVFVECQRAWSSVNNIPILGIPGILSIPEQTSLKDLQLGRSVGAIADKEVINTSNNTDGKARDNDFNTITFVINKSTSRVLSVASTLRQISATKTLQNSDLLTPEEALTNFKNHSSELSLAVPAGKGYTDWNTVYRDNKAQAKDATITDYILFYPEKPRLIAQEGLYPYYLIRGQAKLPSGYTTNFIEIVPASKQQLSILTGPTPPEYSGTVAGVEDTKTLALDQFQVGSQKQGGYTFPTTGISPTVAIPTAPAQPTQPPQAQCTLPETLIPIRIQVPNLGEVTFAYGGSGAHIIFFKSATFPQSDMTTIKQLLDDQIKEQYLISIAKRLGPNPVGAANSSEWYSKYMEIDRAPNFPTCNTGNVAPLTPTCIDAQYNNSSPITHIDAPRAHKITNAVTDTLIQNNSSAFIQSYAQKADVFPADVLNGFVSILWLDKVLPNSSAYGNSAQCYVSGTSPSLFVYPVEETDLTIKVNAPVTYSYPSLDSNRTWQVTVSPSNSLRASSNSSMAMKQLNNETINYLYYEYDPNQVQLTQPSEGFVIHRNEINTFIKNTLSPAFGLTTNEEEQMITEAENTLRKVTKENYVKISIAYENEINEKIPLSFSSQPQTLRRIHLLFTPLSQRPNIAAPQLQQISREGFTAVEIAARLMQ